MELKLGQRVLYHSPVNKHLVLEAEITQLNSDGTVDVIFPDRPGQCKLCVQVADDFPVVEVRGQKLQKPYLTLK